MKFSIAVTYLAGLTTLVQAIPPPPPPADIPCDPIAKYTTADIWPCENYRHKMTRTNPLRCIMNNGTQETTYFENMSRAFTLMSTGTAYAMHKNIDNPIQDGIWGRVEQVTLKAAGGRCNQIDYVQHDATVELSTTKAWTRAAGTKKYRRGFEGAEEEIDGSDEVLLDGDSERGVEERAVQAAAEKCMPSDIDDAITKTDRLW
ncbi:hypothetical protein B0J14DRAFT_556671 [Halenospora varia]|nr:hypothetical protein B0J14DRAFT_556671 [Halenospora varia]